MVPLGRKAGAALQRYLEAGRPKLVTPRSPANVFLTRRGTPFAAVTMWFPRRFRCGTAPFSARLFASVAPDVSTISLGSARRFRRSLAAR